MRAPERVFHADRGVWPRRWRARCFPEKGGDPLSIPSTCSIRHGQAIAASAT